MFEQFPSSESKENAPIRMEQVVEMMATKGKDNEATRVLLRQWTDDNHNNIERDYSDPKMRNYATLSFEIAMAEVYFETGYWQEAMDMLEGEDGENGLLEAAEFSDERELYGIMLDLLGTIYDRSISHEEVVPPEGIPSNKIEDLPTEELQEKLHQAISPDHEDYELAARIRDELKKRTDN